MVRTKALFTNFLRRIAQFAPSPQYDKVNDGLHLFVDELSCLLSYLSRSERVIIVKQLNSVACNVLSVVCRFVFKFNPWY